MKLNKSINTIFFLVLNYSIVGCATSLDTASIYPAEEFSRAAKKGQVEDFSFRKAASKSRARLDSKLSDTDINNLESLQSPPTYQGDAKFLAQGLNLKRSFSAPVVMPDASKIKEAEIGALTTEEQRKTFTMGSGAESARGQLANLGSTPSPLSNKDLSGQNPFSVSNRAIVSPSIQAQFSSNPSLWPDQIQGNFIFNDLRAYNPMDILTITINDLTIGQKRGDTQTKSEFDVLAGITNFFGLDTKWASNNEGLAPGAMVNASTETKYTGTSNIQRQGLLQAQLSAVVVELLPNGVLRIEGSKIVSINTEEEIMVISGLVRQRDIAADNKVESNRIANMRIDFYGHGILSEAQQPGWGARLFGLVWPF